MTPRKTAEPRPLSPVDYHVLLVLAGGDRYGYAIMKALEAESDGVICPEIGSLYRILARLMADGVVQETGGPSPEEAHRGRARRYYRLTRRGRKILRAESVRLEGLMQLARRRKVLTES